VFAERIDPAERYLKRGMFTMKTRMFALAAIAALAAGSALATDATLLGMVPADAKVIAGFRASQAMASPFGQFVLSRMQPAGAEGLQKLTAATGFDPRHDVSEVLIATASPGTHNQGIVAVRGVFDPARIQSAATAHGCTMSTVMGVTMFTAAHGGNDGALALPDATTAMLGDVDSVKAAIARYRSSAKPADELQKKVQSASQDASGAANDFWFVTLAPLSEIVPQAPATASGAAPQNMHAFQSVQQASGGIRFTSENVRLGAQLVMRSDQDAQSIADVVRFLVTMVQSNRQKNPAAGTAASLLDTMTLNTSANVARVALVLPEAQVEQLLNAMAQHKQAESQPTRAN
jgi:hypothetical protein